MKNYLLKSALLILLVFSLGGCYTVVWNPADNNFPTKDNTKLEDSYYSDADYAYFYDYPWWLEITPPNYISGENSNDNSGGNNSGIGSAIIRSLNSGRGEQVRQSWNLNTNPPTQSEVKNKEVEKNNSTNNTSTRSGNNSKDNSTKTRNDDGSRKTDNGRKK